MPGKIVLDSSVIAAVFFPEAITSQAIEIVEQSDGITLDLAYAEVSNVAWKRAVHAKNDPAMTRASLSDCIAFISETCEVIPSRDLVVPAYDLACRHRITVYDALFAAAAARCNAPLVTADAALALSVNSACRTVLVR
jgi:predicted nucleic acid-binding protein